MSYKKFEELEKLANEYAQAEAERVYLTDFKKSKKALLMQRYETHNKGASIAAQEREAYADVEYSELLDGLKVATEKALSLKFKLDVMKMRFETWRTEQATLRAEMNLR